ncbi:cerevisin [Pancytospora philotis]|nr:cerevisin [Pancytospora philotis]
MLLRTLLLAGAALAANKRYIVMFKMPEHASFASMRSYSAMTLESSRGMLGPDDRIYTSLSGGYIAGLSEETRSRLAKDPTIATVEEDTNVKIEVPGGMQFAFNSDVHKVESAPLWAYLGERYRAAMRRWDARARRAAHSGDSPDSRHGNPSKRPETVLNFVMQPDAPWGLGRISGHDTWYEYIEGMGRQVYAYVLDTGIDTAHPDFEGRARWGYNAVPGSPDADEHGHGTHCAGTIGGKRTGVAKSVNLVAVKTLNGAGEGKISALIEGIDFVMRDYESRVAAYEESAGTEYMEELAREDGRYSAQGLLSTLRNLFRDRKERPQAVVNMSIGGGRSAALNFAIQYASKYLNIHFVTAAGNESANACDYSPASSQHAITVGASDNSNRATGFSNRGMCVDVYAPGMNILSTWPGKTMKMASGTSMATPHVTGILAVYLSLSGFTPEKLRERVLKDANALIEETGVAPIQSSMLYPSGAELSLLYSAQRLPGVALSLPWHWARPTSVTDKAPMASLEKLYERLKAE